MYRIILLSLLTATTFICHAQDYVKFTAKGKVGFKTGDGKIIIPAKYDDAWERFTEGLIGVEIKGKWGYIDSVGKIIVPFKYLEVSPYFLKDVKLARVYVGTASKYKTGYVNTQGKEIIPAIYDGLQDRFINNIVSGCINKKCGALDNTGKIVIPLMYENLMTFVNGRYIVRRNGWTGVVDSVNKEVIKFDYSDITWNFGLLEVQNGDKYGLYDIHGKQLTPCVWDSIVYMGEEDIPNNKYGKVYALRDKTHASYIDKQGKMVDKYGHDL